MSESESGFVGKYEGQDFSDEVEDEEPQTSEESETKKIIFQVDAFVKEQDEMKKLLQSLESAEEEEFLKNCATLKTIIGKYSEQPQLLEPFLFDLVHPLVRHLRVHPPVFVRINAASDVLYILSIVCGPKSIVKVFPHEVCDLEPALQLWKCESEEISWQTRYTLLIWMSMLVMIPFDISSIESAKLLFKEDVIQECIHMLHNTTKVQEGAAFLLSRILTRPDMVKVHLPSFFEFCCREMSRDDVGASESDDPSTSRRIIIGCLQTLANIFKIGVREELQPFVEIIASQIFALARNTKCTTTRKYCVKVIQRIGMVYLKPRVAKWRYQRGARSLLDTLRKSKGEIRTNVKQDGQDAQSADAKLMSGNGSKDRRDHMKDGNGDHDDDADDEDYEIPDELEDVIDVLLLGLCDRNTIVRWSAAKGIGRITMRLPKELATDVVSTVLDLFKPSQGDHAWHGGCLALAELARRGLFLPDRLEVAVPIVIKALEYDVPRGAHSVGSHVRDAACYVCWSFARAYAPVVMQPYVDDLGRALLILSSLDREVNCRRAAAAAFQENVGRQGTFPHGIEIITAADYYTLSNRKRSYLEIAPFVGKFETYRAHFIDHLVHVKLCHWDSTIRELAAKSLAEFTDVDAGSIFDEIVPELLESALDTDLLVRHGAVLGLSEVLGRGLPSSQQDDEKAITKAAELRKSLALLVPRIDQARLYRGKGGELMRAAVSRYILSLSRSGIKLPRKLKMTGVFGPRPVVMNPLKVHQDTLDENLKHPKEEISQSAVEAFEEFSKAYYPEWSETFNKEVLSVYIDGLEKDDNPGLRRGFTLALGALPKYLLVPRLEEIVACLLLSMRIEKEKSKRDAETRRNGARSIIRVVRSVGVKCGEGETEVTMTKDQISRIFDGLIGGMNDYSTDRRGDVGSWVRMASMQSLEELTSILAETQYRLSQSDIVLMMANVCRQMADKIDRVREAAGITLERLLRNAINLSSFPLLEAAVKKLDEKPIDWSVPTMSFHFLVHLLDVNEFRTEVLEGLIVAMGGITEHVAQAALFAWKKYSTKHSDSLESALALTGSLMDICKRRRGVNRVVIPLFRCSETLLSSSLISKIRPPEHSFANDFIDFVRKEMIVTKSVMKLLEGVNTFCVLMSFGGAVQKDAIIQLLLLLNHQYPKVRRTASEQLYTMMLALEEGIVDDDLLDDVLIVLSETRWDGDDTDEIISQQNLIFSLLKIEKPTRNEYNASAEDSADGSNSQTLHGDESSYGDLVKEMGY